MTRKVKVDYWLIVASLFATVLGLIAIFDAGYAAAAANGSIVPREFLMQTIFAIVSITLGFFLMKIDAKKWQKLAPWSIGLALVLLALVEVPGLGKSVGGARRWIDLKVFSLQPAEFAKIAVILFVAGVLATRKQWLSPHLKRKGDWLKKIGIPKLDRALFLIPIGLCVFLIEREPDMATAMVLVVCTFILMVRGGVSWKSLTLLTIAGVGLVMFMVFAQPYRMSRITNHSQRWETSVMEAEGYQTTQSETALASGGLIGVGLGEGRAKHTLPAATTDFISTTIGEEFGLAGSLGMILLLGFITLRLFVQANFQKNKFDRLVLTGVATWIGIQSATNIMMANGHFPPIGIPLPFFSYGGSSLLAVWMALGISVAVSSRNADKQDPPSRRGRGSRRRSSTTSSSRLSKHGAITVR